MRPVYSDWSACCTYQAQIYVSNNIKQARILTGHGLSVFQLGLFLRALRPACTGLRPARFTRTLTEFKKKKKTYFLILQNVIAVFVFSDSRCKNACKMLADLCPCFHQSPTRLNFGRSHVQKNVSFTH